MFIYLNGLDPGPAHRLRQRHENVEVVAVYGRQPLSQQESGVGLWTVKQLKTQSLGIADKYEMV